MNFFIGNQTKKLLLLNNLQPDIKVKQRELFNNKCIVNTFEKYSSLSNITNEFFIIENDFKRNHLFLFLSIYILN